MPRAGLTAALLAVLIFGTPVAATAQQFGDLFDAGMQARRAGNFETAAQKFTESLSIAPGNVDALLQLATVQGFLKRYDAALVNLNAAIVLAPDYVDLRIARARILFWAGRTDAATSAIEAVLERAPDNAEARTLKEKLSRQKVTAAALSWRLDMGYGQSRFGRVVRKDWHEGYFQVGHDVTGNTNVHLRVEEAKRFADADTYIRAGIAHRFNQRSGGYVNIGTTPAATFLPRTKLEIGADTRILDGNDGLFGATIARLDLSHRDYASGDINNIDPGVQQYLFGGRAWLTGRWINSYDLKPSKRLAGWSGRADWQALDSLRVFAGMSSAPETESGSSVNTLSHFAGLTWDATDTVGLNAALTRDNRKNSYIRDVFTIGATYRF